MKKKKKVKEITTPKKLKINGIILIQKGKNSISNSKLFLGKIKIEANQKFVPIPTNMSSNKKPIKMLPILNKNKGKPKIKEDSCAKLNINLKPLGLSKNVKYNNLKE